MLALGVQICANLLDAETLFEIPVDANAKILTVYEDGTTKTALTTTWSYKTSDEAEGAGHASDVFVVPSYLLTIHTVHVISFDQTTCNGVSGNLTVSDINTNGDNAVAFLSKEGLDEQIESMKDTMELIDKQLKDNSTSAYVAGLNDALGQINQTLANWETYMEDYELVNEFNSSAGLLKPGDWLQGLISECPDVTWGPSILCSTIIQERCKEELVGKRLHNPYTGFEVEFLGSYCSMSYYRDWIIDELEKMDVPLTLPFPIDEHWSSLLPI